MFSGGQIYQVQSYIVHEKYNEITQNNDVAILKLSKPIIFNKFVSPIKLASRRRRDNTLVTISGWGKQSDSGSASDMLMKVKVPINQKSCFQHQIRNDHICTGWKGKIQSSKFKIFSFLIKDRPKNNVYFI